MEFLGLVIVLLTLGLLLGAVFGWISFFKISKLQDQIQLLHRELSHLAHAAKKAESQAEVSVRQSQHHEKPADEQPAVAVNEQPDTSSGLDSQKLDAKQDDAELQHIEEIQRDGEAVVPETPSQTPVTPPSVAAALRKASPDRAEQLAEHLKEFWMIWVGGISIGLAGIFLVKYSIDAGLLNPATRIGLALATGVILHAVAEWLRRKNKGSDPVFAALAGGASITLYAAFLAALELYQMLSPTVAFAAMAAVALATIALAVMHGPVLAIIGLLGGYIVPLLVSEGEGNIVIAMIYALIITFAALVLMRRVFRLWLWLGMFAGTLSWWFLSLFDPGADSFRGLYLALFSYGVLAVSNDDYFLRGTKKHTVEPSAIATAEKKIPKLLYASIALLLGACAISLFVEGLSASSLVRWVPFTFVILWATSQQDKFRVFSWCLMAVQLVSLLLSDLTIYYFGGLAFQGASLGTEAVVFSFAACMAALYSFAAYRAIGLGQNSAIWYSLGFMSPVLWLAFCYLVVAEMRVTWEWGAVAALLGIGYLVLAGKRNLQSGQSEKDSAMIWLTFSGHAAIALAMVISFREASLTLGIALQLLSLAWLIKRFQIDGLNWLVKVMLSIVIVRLTLNPWVMTYSTDTHWSLWTYGGCTLLTALAAYQLSANNRLKCWLEAAAIHLLILTVVMEVRYWLYNGKIFSGSYDLVEAAINAAFLGALSLCYVYRARFSDALRAWYLGMSEIILALAALNYFFALTLLNPLFGADPVSTTPVFNLLILAYGVPPILALLIMKFHKPEYRKPAAWAAGVGTFIFVSMEIHHIWQGRLDFNAPISSGELYTYSLVWLSAAIALVLYSSARVKPSLYRASMGFLGLVIAKIFLVDMSDLEGLLRVVSFMGLGIALLGLAFLHRSIRANLSEKPVL